MGEVKTDFIWRILIGIFTITFALLIFFGSELKEIGMHKITFFICAFLALPVAIYILTEVLKVKE